MCRNILHDEYNGDKNIFLHLLFYNKFSDKNDKSFIIFSSSEKVLNTFYNF